MFEKEIKDRLTAIQNSHAKISYEEIGKLLGLSKTTVANILGESRPPKNPTIDLLLKVFPHAVIYLDGDKGITQTVSGTGNTAPAVVGDNNNFFTGDGKAESIAEKIKAAVMRSDLTPEAKVKVWEIIEAVKAENK